MVSPIVESALASAATCLGILLSLWLMGKGMRWASRGPLSEPQPSLGERAATYRSMGALTKAEMAAKQQLMIDVETVAANGIVIEKQGSLDRRFRSNCRRCKTVFTYPMSTVRVCSGPACPHCGAETNHLLSGEIES